MISEELILERDRVKCLVNELTTLLKTPEYFQFKIRVTNDKIIIIPHVNSVEIVR